MNSAKNQNYKIEENITFREAKTKERIEEKFTRPKSSNWKGYQVLGKMTEKISDISQIHR